MIPARTRIGRLLLITVSLVLLSGCATMSKRRAQVEDGRYWPRGSSWSRAAKTALQDPNTWGPAAGAAVIAIGGWDDDISDWAVENTPIFGSTENAVDASDTLRTLSHVSMISTALAAPNQPGPWGSRIGRWAIEEAGVITATQTTSVLKGVTGRERPDGEDDRSFPSGHATRAFAYVANSRRNLDLMKLSNTARNALKSGFTALAAGSGWARVEGGKHYPTDVLVGAALGNFVAILIHDAFLGRESRVAVETSLSSDGGSLAIRIRF